MQMIWKCECRGLVVVEYRGPVSMKAEHPLEWGQNLCWYESRGVVGVPFVRIPRGLFVLYVPRKKTQQIVDTFYFDGIKPAHKLPWIHGNNLNINTVASHRISRHRSGPDSFSTAPLLSAWYVMHSQIAQHIHNMSLNTSSNNRLSIIDSLTATRSKYGQTWYHYLKYKNAYNYCSL